MFWWDRLERAVAARLTDEAELRDLVPAREGGVAAGSRRLREIATDIEFIDPWRPRRPVRALGGSPRPGSRDRGAATRRRSRPLLRRPARDRLSHPLSLQPDDPRRRAAGRRVDRGTGRGHGGGRATGHEHRLPGRALEPPRARRGPGGRVRARLDLRSDPTFPDSDPIHVGRLVPAWCTDLAAFAFTVARAVDGHYPPWPIPPERPGPVAAPRLRAFAPGEPPATRAPAEEAKLALPS